MNLSVRSPSVLAIKEALKDKINTFPDTVKGYNQSRPFRLALNEIEDNEHFNRKSRHSRSSGKDR